MAMPAPRDLPWTEATYQPLRRLWLVRLPSGVELPAKDEAEIEAIHQRLARYSALRYIRPAGEG